ncbi:MAG: hypothetical protein IJ018_04470, partial [Bacilli bacterium]|nr:hypothetical protein [Bacilli bacterium]
MHDKLKLLLEQVNMPVELYSDFKYGNLDRINVNKKDNSVKFLITLDKILPVDTYDRLNNLINEKYNMYDEKKVVCNIVSKDYGEVEKYYNHFISVYSKEQPLLDMFRGINANIENDTLTLEVSNKAEEMKLSSILDRLKEDLNNVGYNDLIINININIEASNAILKQIEEDKQKEALALKQEEEKKSLIIKGRDFDSTNAKAISELNYEGDNIIIEGKI